MPLLFLRCYAMNLSKNHCLLAAAESLGGTRELSVAGRATMGQGQSSSFTARIVNCLQTILELEPMLRRIDSERMLLSEFDKLKAFLNEMNGIELDEEDVARIETATERFLEELRFPVGMASPDEPQNMTLH